MENVFKFLQENPIFYLATVEDNMPRVRPLGFSMIHDGKLCFCTSNKKPMFKQLSEHPYAEISTTSADGTWLRLCGKVNFVTTPESQQAALDAAPFLSGMYSVGDGSFEVFAIEEATAVFVSRAEGAKTIQF